MKKIILGAALAATMGAASAHTVYETKCYNTANTASQGDAFAGLLFGAAIGDALSDGDGGSTAAGALLGLAAAGNNSQQRCYEVKVPHRHYTEMVEVDKIDWY